MYFISRNLQEAEDQLAALTNGLETVEERVSALKEQLGQHTREAAALELQVGDATATLDAARSLFAQLAHEYTAWEVDVSIACSFFDACHSK